MWLRWQSAPVTTRGDIDQAWQRADLWSQNAGTDDQAREVAVTPLDDWQIFFFRENAWTNPQSASSTTVTTPAPGNAGTSTTTTTNPLPDGVRLVLDLPPGRALSGRLQRDWMRPTLTP